MTYDSKSPERPAGGAREAGASLPGAPMRLACRDVSKTYAAADGGQSVAVQDVSFEIRTGEFVSLVGPSGCGKTTILKACAGLVPVSSGTIDYEGTGRPAKAGTYGMVFQTPTLLPWWTVLENVVLPARVLGIDMKRSRDRARDLLELVGLVGVDDRYPGELSGGMQQRASLARALLHEPDLVFMDEPFGALDAITRDMMNDLLQRVQRELSQTILFVTHSIGEAIWLSDRVLVMSRGPGRIIDTVDIEFVRPRGLDLSADERFRELELNLKKHLYDSLESAPDQQQERS